MRNADDADPGPRINADQETGHCFHPVVDPRSDPRHPRSVFQACLPSLSSTFFVIRVDDRVVAAQAVAQSVVPTVTTVPPRV